MSHNSCGLCSVEFCGVTVRSGSDTLLEDIDLAFHCGELTALIGKNGAGKTTLIKAILGERRFQGTLRFQDHHGNILKSPRIGYVPQHLEFDRSQPITVEDFMIAANKGSAVWLGRSKAERERVRSTLADMDCDHLAKRRLGELSGGELQRVLLSLAATPVPELLILDEPVSGMDVTGLDLFYKAVQELRDRYHMAILLVSHDLGLIARYADKVVLLDKRVIASGETAEVFATEAFRGAFGYLHREEGERWS